MGSKQPMGTKPPPKLPDNWTSDGVSKGKEKGAVRPTQDAYNGKRK